MDPKCSLALHINMIHIYRLVKQEQQHDMLPTRTPPSQRRASVFTLWLLKLPNPVLHVGWIAREKFGRLWWFIIIEWCCGVRGHEAWRWEVVATGFIKLRRWWSASGCTQAKTANASIQYIYKYTQICTYIFIIIHIFICTYMYAYIYMPYKNLCKHKLPEVPRYIY